MEHNQRIGVNGPVIVRAEPSGKATSACLTEQNLPFVVLERADCVASMWQNRTYERLKLYLPKQFCQLSKMQFPANFAEYPAKRQFIEYYASQFEISRKLNECVPTAQFNEASGLGRVKTVSNAESTRARAEYICRWFVGSTGDNAERVLPETEGPSELTGEMTYHVNWKGTQALDRVLEQETQVCYAISMTRQLGALLRLKGLLEPQESLSIQYVINEARRLLFNEERPTGFEWDGSIAQLEMLTPLYTLKGIVLDELEPLTYSLKSTNLTSDDGVRRFNATKIIHHYLGSYNDDETFEGKLLSLLMVSPVSVVVRSYDSFWRIVGADIYHPTESDLSNNTKVYYHAMLLTGAGYDQNGNEFWECQDSVGDDWRGDRGFIKIARGGKLISQFVDMSV